MLLARARGAQGDQKAPECPRMRLPDIEDLPGLGLREVARFDEPVNLERQVGLQLLALGVRKSKVAEDVAAASRNASKISCSRSACFRSRFAI